MATVRYRKGLRVSWFGDEVTENIQDGMAENLDRAAIIWKRHAQVESSKKTNRDGETPSLRGDYPALVTNTLVKSINWERRGKMRRRVGSNLIYAKFLELGTKSHTITIKNAKVLSNGKKFFGKKVTVSMKPRPWLSRSLREKKSEIKKLLSRRVK